MSARAASRGTAYECSGICLPGTTRAQCNSCKSCLCGHKRHSQVATPEPNNRASRRRTCRTWNMAASPQPSKAISSLQRIPGLSAQNHPLPNSHRPSEPLLVPSPPLGAEIARPHIAAGRGSRTGLAFSHENSEVHFPLLRRCPRTFGISQYLRTHCIDRPFQALFLFLILFRCWSSLRGW